MANQNQNEPVEARKDPFPFYLATICTLPFAYILGSFVFGKPIGPVPVIFGFAFLIPLSVIAFVVIVAAWMRSPHYWRFVLFFYPWFIIGCWILFSRIEPF